jgi:hypothetical protein
MNIMDGNLKGGTMDGTLNGGTMDSNQTRKFVFRS